MRVCEYFKTYGDVSIEMNVAVKAFCQEHTHSTES